MRLLVCGGRDYTNKNTLYRFLSAMNSDGEVSVIIHGDAQGADTLAKNWAIENEVPHIPFPADWKTHGKAAGPIRNQKMLDEGKPNLVIAFAGGKGTQDMINRAIAHGLYVVHKKEDGSTITYGK